MIGIGSFFMAAAEIVPAAAGNGDRKLVVRMLQASDRERAVVSFLGNLRSAFPGHYSGLVEVVEISPPLLNTIAVSVLGDELNVQAPPVARAIIDRFYAKGNGDSSTNENSHQEDKQRVD